MSEEAPRTSGISRRTMIKASAWSTPVIAVSVAVPAAAASITPSLRIVGPARMTGVIGQWEDYSFTVYTGPTGTNPAASLPVTVVRPLGMSWTGGGPRVKTFITDANGVVSLTGQFAPATAFIYAPASRSFVISAEDAFPLTVDAPVFPTAFSIFISGDQVAGQPVGTLKLTFDNQDLARPLAPGFAATFELQAGLTWADGTTSSKAFTADGNGAIDLTGQILTTAPGSYTVTITCAAYGVTTFTVGGTAYPFDVGSFTFNVV